MTRKKEVTEEELNELLERFDALAIDTGDVIDRLGMRAYSEPAAKASTALGCATTFLELARKLAIQSRHAEMKRDTEAQVRAQFNTAS